MVRSRLDCQINADNNRCRGDRPALKTGRFIAWIKGWYPIRKGSSPDWTRAAQANMSQP
jgi:hypothetical protein